MALELRFLGSVAVFVDGRESPLRHRRAVLLLALLALRGGRPVERGLLAEAIWPEREPEEAAVNLRRALADLREMLGPEADRVSAPDRRTLSLNATCDVLDFDAAARRFRQDANPKEARRALEVYRGPLLEGWSDEYIEPERRHREETAASLAEACAQRALAEGRTEEALRFLDQAESISPSRESTLRLRLDAHLARGDGMAAQATYAAFVRRLDHELGLEPGAETARLAERLRPVSPVETRPRTAWPLVGRGAELARLRGALEEGGVVTVVGPGGVGKTRLALAAIEGTGASFVDLARLPAHASVREVAEAVDAPGDPLVLDNAEHLLPTVALAVEDALRAHRAILVTSRKPLIVSGERLVRLAPLDAVDAARLFAARAEAVRPGTTLDSGRVEQVCERLERIPLALELAAARLRTLTLADLQTRLDGRGGVDLLANASVGAPERQRTMARTVQWSLSLLSDEARRALGRLAAFRAGFTLAAAEAVVGPGALDALSELVDHSLVLVEEEEAPRYRILETVRTVADAETDSAEAGRALGRWAAAFVAEADLGLWRGGAGDLSRRIEREWANLQAAVERGDSADVTGVVDAVDPIWWRAGRFREGIAWRETARGRALDVGDVEGAARHALIAEQFRRLLGEPNRARAAFREAADARIAADDARIATYFLHSLGYIERDDGDLARAAATMREGLALAERIDEPGLVAYARRGLAAVDLAAGRPHEAVAGLQDAATIFRKEGIPVQETITLASLAEAMLGAKDFEGAASMAGLAAQNAREQRSATVEASAELVAGRAALALGDVDEAAQRLDAADAAVSDQGSSESRAELAVARSALARARGASHPRIMLEFLREPAAAHLPYPTLLRVVEEAARALRAVGSLGSAFRLEEEFAAAREAAEAGAWSAGLTVTRALAAFPAETLRAA